MKGLKKKVLCLVMALAMVVSILPGMSVVAKAADPTYTLELGHATITYTSPNGEGMTTSFENPDGNEKIMVTLPYGSKIVDVDATVDERYSSNDYYPAFYYKNASQTLPQEADYLQNEEFCVTEDQFRSPKTHISPNYCRAINDFWRANNYYQKIPYENVKGFVITCAYCADDVGFYPDDMWSNYCYLIQISTAEPKAADEIVERIKNIGDMSRDKIDEVEEIRKDYDKLSDEEKNEVSEEILNILIAAENMIPVYAVEDEIAEIGIVTLDSTSAIESARTKFNALSDEQKALVTNENDLLAAEKELAYLEKNNDKAQAAAVEAMIKAIPVYNSVTLDDEQTIKAARAAYNALTDVQKAKVTNVGFLTFVESKITSLKNAKKAQDLIEALPETLTVSDKTKVNNAKNAYDALTDYEKTLVPTATVNKLNTSLAEMEKVLEAAPSHTVEVSGAFALEYDGVSGSSVKEIGTTTNGKVYLVTLPAGAKATGLYNGTSGNGVTYFYYPESADNVGTGRLNAYYWERTQSAMVFNVSNTFYNDQFAFLQTYLNKKDTIKQNLSETLPTQDVKGFAFGSSYAIVYVQIKLTDVESVTKKIEALGDATEENLDTIEAVKAAYDNLSEEEKAQISNVDKLNTAVEAMEAMKAKAAADKAAADAVIEQIKALDTVTADNVADVATAREAYDALTDAQKALVDEKTVGILEKAEATAKYETAKKEYESLKESNNASNAELEAAKKELEAAKTELAKEKAKNQTVTGLKVTSKSKKLTVTWKKNSAVKGYQVSYKLKSAKKYVTMKKTTGTKVRSKALKKGKVYQVKVRPYSVIGGKTIYGRWTSVKTIKCK